jgi:hypothetical protein
MKYHIILKDNLIRTSPNLIKIQHNVKFGTIEEQSNIKISDIPAWHHSS